MSDYSIERLGGDLARRIDLCQKRMEERDYSAENVFRPADYEWYGDWEGRALLAMSCLKRYYGKPCSNYEPCWRRLDSALNEQGYFGPLFDMHGVNEQQLAGNGWYLRALCTEYEMEGTPSLKKKIEDVVHNLFLRNSAVFSGYPVNENGNNGVGYAAGTLSKTIGNWKLSSDSGCMYISLDGLTHAYSILRDQALEAFIRRMIAQFASTDLHKKNFQAHAFLSGVRGLVRFAETVHDAAVFRLAQQYFAFYAETSMNYVYENYGVLNSPDSSEGCAVIDAAMLCAALYRYTHDAMYLALYRKIYVNAIRANQRSNGGMGCDVGIGSNQIDYIASVPEFTEATWCCTMRGCEGMTEFARNLYCVNGDTIVPMLLNDNTATFFHGAVEIEEKTDYPYDGKTVFSVVKCDRPFSLQLFLFDGYEVSGVREGQSVFIDRPCTVTVYHSGKDRVRTIDGKRGYEHGDMILGEAVSATADRYYVIDDRKLQQLVSISEIDIRSLPSFRQKLLF